MDAAAGHIQWSMNEVCCTVPPIMAGLSYG